MKESVSQLVWLYVKQRPFLQEVLKGGVVNHSALARKISIEAFGSVKRENAVKMALIRLGERMEQLDSDLEGRILGILNKSSMVLKSKVAVVIAKRELDGIHPLSYVKSGRHLTYIIEQRDLEKVPEKALWKHKENLNLITIESPEALEEVPGVIAYILSALASEGVNVEEFISCYTDTILAVREADSAKAYALLSSILR